jgi:cytochrome c oxidase cbb3-type subunit 4
MTWQEIHDLFAPIRLVWFVVIFVGVVAWAYWPKRRAELEKLARIPLEDELPDDQRSTPVREGKS